MGFSRLRGSDGRFDSRPTASVVERFESNFDKQDGCWNWNGAIKSHFGYGAFKIGSRSSKVMPAHRMSYVLYVSEIPDGLVVMHKCDNPRCVNPSHLSLGTPRDNAHDAMKKGRNMHGSGHVFAKIDEAVAMQIYNRRKEGSRALGSEFGISRQSARDIIAKRTWKHIHG